MISFIFTLWWHKKAAVGAAPVIEENEEKKEEPPEIDPEIYTIIEETKITINKMKITRHMAARGATSTEIRARMWRDI